MPGDTARANGKLGGRPKGRKNAETLTKEALREVVRQRVAAALEPMLKAQIENAQGLAYLVSRDPKSGKFTPVDDVSRIDDATEIWLKQPNVQAFTDLLNRCLDKPAEQVQEIKVTGEVNIVQRLQSARQRLARQS